MNESSLLALFVLVMIVDLFPSADFFREQFRRACLGYRVNVQDVLLPSLPIWTELASQVTAAPLETIRAVDLWPLISTGNMFNSAAYPWIKAPIQDKRVLYEVTLENFTWLESKEGVVYSITRDASGSPTSLSLTSKISVAGGTEMSVEIYTTDINLVVTHLAQAIPKVKSNWFALTVFIDEALLEHPIVRKIVAATDTHLDPFLKRNSVSVAWQRDVKQQ